MVTYNTLLAGYVGTNRFNFVEQLIQEMKQLEKQKQSLIYLSETIYNTIINGYSRAGEPYKAIEMLEEMISNRYQPNKVTYDAILFGFSKKGNPIECEQFFRQEYFQSHGNENENNKSKELIERKIIYPDENSFRFVMTCYGKQRLFGDVERLFNEMITLLYETQSQSSNLSSSTSSSTPTSSLIPLKKLNSSIYLLLIDISNFHDDLENMQK